jgi:hypothetical protein
MKKKQFLKKEMTYENMGKMGRIVYALGNYDREGAKF